MLHVTIEPAVIDQELVSKAINDQLNADVAEIAKKEGIDSGQVTKLSLDFKSNKIS
jgi:hypothetical protein